MQPQSLTRIVIGIYIGLGALAFNYTFPLKITAPPYNWSEVTPHSPLRQAEAK